jgi:hypothetical protein
MLGRTTQGRRYVMDTPSTVRPPFRVLLIGLSGAGKSTQARSIAPQWQLPHINIDDFRREHGDATVAGDYFARAHFLRACSRMPAGLFEFSGSGVHRHAVRQAFQENPSALLTVWLDAPHVRRNERISGREEPGVPWPGWKATAPVGTVDEDGRKTLAKDLADGFWEGPPGWRAARLDADVSREVLHQGICELLASFASGLCSGSRT